MDLSGNVQSLVRSSWSTNTTPTPPRAELPSSTNLPPNITEGPPPLEQTAPVSLTTKSNVPALLKVSEKIFLYHKSTNILRMDLMKYSNNKMLIF